MSCQGVTVGTFTIFTFEDWNLFDDSRRLGRRHLRHPEEKLPKLADPARRPGLIEGVKTSSGPRRSPRSATSSS